MIDIINTYVKYIILHRWNKLSKRSIDLLENHWEHKPKKFIKKWLYEKVKIKNNYYTKHCARCGVAVSKTETKYGTFCVDCKNYFYKTHPNITH